MIFFGCLFLGFAIRIAMVSGKENPYLIHPDDTPETAGALGLEIRKVTRLPNGNYYWTCEVDNEYEQDSYRITMLACGGICVFLLVVTLLFMRDMETLLIVTGCCAFVMLLAFGISKLMLLGPGHLRIPYEMSEEWIHIGTGKGSTYVSYKNVKQMKREGNKIRLQTAFTKSVVFIPEEDYEVISAYIFQRIREESHDYRG